MLKTAGEVFEEAFLDELEKLANDDSEPNLSFFERHPKAILGTGAALAALGAGAALAHKKGKLPKADSVKRVFQRKTKSTPAHSGGGGSPGSGPSKPATLPAPRREVTPAPRKPAAPRPVPKAEGIHKMPRRFEVAYNKLFGPKASAGGVDEHIQAARNLPKPPRRTKAEASDLRAKLHDNSIPSRELRWEEAIDKHFSSEKLSSLRLASCIALAYSRS